MRIDKYLWCIRYCKTRNIGTEACKKGHVKINDQVVKPSREVYPGDKIIYRKNQVDYQLNVLDIPPNRVGAKLVDIYRVDTTPKEAFEHANLVKLSQDYYRKKGAGRPTKKDRRSIEDYLDPDDESFTSESKDE
ncbi:RNA-binding protein S4 [Neptunitalea chrysea]|uniref:RNA-binding protein S4 n=1 Tax=Neptunitalea chrysea TaxID=1647581 RepID=A0A9W6B6K6_9FLAO|nr:RNA-binding S4 domain-containing protein [Neptunitalea chrysea]GLB52242.1 RNA-binding protein S4 [Neptunitalea chrysea]